jgi:exo-beta-1,3-glucanase (GH17 family)
LSSNSPTRTAAGTAHTSTTASSANTTPLNRVGVPSFDPSKPFAISYSPYTSSGGCKDVSTISSDLRTISAAGFQGIRIYGTDCNQVSNVLSAISSSGINLKVFLGIFDLGSASSEASIIISAVKGDWSRVVTISVGNEVVNSGQASVSTVVSTTSAVRSQLRRYLHSLSLLIIVLVIPDQSLPLTHLSPF